VCDVISVMVFEKLILSTTASSYCPCASIKYAVIPGAVVRVLIFLRNSK